MSATFFAFDITVPAGTADASPTKERLPLTYGKITTVEIKFPAGCHGLVKVRLIREGSQIVPLSSNEYVIGDDETIIANVGHELKTGDASLTFQGSSPSATYAHTITIRINIEPLPQAGAVDLSTLNQKLDEIILRLSEYITAEGQPAPAPEPAPTPEPSPIPPAETVPSDIYKITDVHDFFSATANYATLTIDELSYALGYIGARLIQLTEAELKDLFFNWTKNAYNRGLFNQKELTDYRLNISEALKQLTQ